VLIVASVGAVVVLAGGGGDDDDGGAATPTGEYRLKVVVSDPANADLVRRVAGDAVKVDSIVPVGADGHTYEPRPEDARLAAEANVFIENGMGLNNVVSDFVRGNLPGGAGDYALSGSIPSYEVIATDTAAEIASHGHAHSFNAHFWPDPNYAILYTQQIADILSAHDPDDAAGYAQRRDAQVGELRALDGAIRASVDTIPDDNRKLVVYHDSWSYFGRRYDLPVVGAIQPVSFSEPSAQEVRTTINEVRREGVPAFFGSEVFPSDVLEAIAEESGAKYYADLSDDRLPGEPGSRAHSYVGMMAANVRLIVTALGGDPAALDAVDPARA
jgi:ABC-type Zn uptake system ZnuABC Zn-binding protein ZnuA